MANKTLIGCAAALLVAGGAVGGNMYAAKKLEHAYRNNFNLDDKRLAVTVSEFNMGAMSGSAKWSAAITPDLCSPDASLSAISEDTISLGLSGYTIRSKISVKNPDTGKLYHLFDAETQKSWFGGTHTDITAKDTLTEDGAKAEWQADAHFDVKSNANGHSLSNLSVNVPRFALDLPNGEGSFLLENAVLKSDGGAPSLAAMQSGKGLLTVQSFSVKAQQDGKPFSVGISDLQINSSQTVGKDKFDAEAGYAIGAIKVSGGDKDFAFEQMKLNFGVKGLDAAVFAKLVPLMEQQAQRCVRPEEIAKVTKENALSALNTGFTLESKGNQIRLGNSGAKADGELVFSPAKAASTDEWFQQVQQHMKYKAEASVDKQFLREAAKIIGSSMGQPMPEEELEKNINMLAQTPFAEDQGDKIVWKVQQ